MGHGTWLTDPHRIVYNLRFEPLFAIKWFKIEVVDDFSGFFEKAEIKMPGQENDSQMSIIYNLKFEPLASEKWSKIEVIDDFAGLNGEQLAVVQQSNQSRYQ